MPVLDLSIPLNKAHMQGGNSQPAVFEISVNEKDGLNL